MRIFLNLIISLLILLISRCKIKLETYMVILNTFALRSNFDINLLINMLTLQNRT